MDSSWQAAGQVCGQELHQVHPGEEGDVHAADSQAQARECGDMQAMDLCVFGFLVVFLILLMYIYSV